ncbi:MULTISPECIES: DUF6427 family protein [Flavobacterium]|uniref:DUF6427 family protein n=1 Tax=Flavobacterium keumense TaxID=1306518 RepID=A0ABY8N6P3_9FLAO|nr:MULTISPECIES: DUF6427 family protein [Flavobacterium]WGK95212.1 DUF6427 family protein [Flavobacterium keumense]
MIASVFKKSTPLNYALTVFLVLFFFFIYQIQDTSWVASGVLLLKKAFTFLVVLASIFLTSFIGKRNGLTKNSSYTAIFFLLLLLFFPTILNNLNILLANFFILLALRRLISLQSMKASKEKIFDASLWIFVASLFSFWSILFLILVFISVIFHVSRDYTNWVLPFIAFIAVAIFFAFFTSFFGINILDYWHQNTQIDIAIDYFTNTNQNIAFSIYVSVALFFVFSMFITLSHRPSITQTSYKKIVASFFIGVIVFVLSANKSSDFLLLTIAPLAILASAHLEYLQTKFKQEMVFIAVVLCSLFSFVSQL